MENTPQISPLVSIITPVYNTPKKVLIECIDSVRSQTYKNWELCLVDDKSPNEECRKVIQKFAKKDSRIRYSFRGINGGIVAASNDAIDLSSGEFIALLDHDDVLEPDALEQVIKVFETKPAVDYVYTDEDLLDEEGKRFQPFRKPDWSPERFRNQMYTCHFSVIRRSLVEEVGRFREGFDGSQDYDLILRISEKAREIHHIPIILYHWRVGRDSVAANPNAKPYAYTAGQKAITEHLERVGLEGNVFRRFDLPGNYEVVRSPSYNKEIDVLIIGENRKVNYWGSSVDSVELSTWSLTKNSTYRHINLSRAEVPEGLQAKIINQFIHNSNNEFVTICSDGAIVSTFGPTESFRWAETFLGFMQSADTAIVGGYIWT
jgi:glycosyltransferase involved in cell wall biosynthesis